MRNQRSPRRILEDIEAEFFLYTYSIAYLHCTASFETHPWEGSGHADAAAVSHFIHIPPRCFPRSHISCDN
jgi:hypothetical protein